MRLAPRLVRNAAASVALIFAVAAPIQVIAAPLLDEGAPVANGGATIDLFGNQRTMAFTVVENPVTGAVSGQVQINIPATGQIVHASVESYYDTGTDLILVGPVTHAVNANASVGDYQITSVRDGGPGGSADTITYAVAYPFAFTAEDIVQAVPLEVIIDVFLGGYRPLTAGNVTIH